MKEGHREINRYIRSVSSYLPCSRKQKKQLLIALRSEAEAYYNIKTGATELEERFGTPQQVAAAYVDAMSTQELLGALRRKRQILTVLVSAVLAALLLWIAVLCISLNNYQQDLNGPNVSYIIEE